MTAASQSLYSGHKKETMKHTLPKTLPGDWIASFKQPSSEGCYEAFVVIRATDPGEYDKYQVHTAFYKDEGEQQGWAYSHGDYVQTLEAATSRFMERAGLLNSIDEAGKITKLQERADKFFALSEKKDKERLEGLKKLIA